MFFFLSNRVIFRVVDFYLSGSILMCFFILLSVFYCSLTLFLYQFGVATVATAYNAIDSNVTIFTNWMNDDINRSKSVGSSHQYMLLSHTVWSSIFSWECVPRFDLILYSLLCLLLRGYLRLCWCECENQFHASLCSKHTCSSMHKHDHSNTHTHARPSNCANAAWSSAPRLCVGA